MKAAWTCLFVLLLAVVGWLIFYFYESRREHRFDKQIVAAANRYKIEPALVKAVVWQESRLKEDALGGAGEVGLMQIQETAAREWADAERLRSFEVAALLDPSTNLLAGTYYLSKVLKRYQKADNPAAYALADYNAGRSRVLKWNKGSAATNSADFLAQMDFPGTKRYIQNILERRGHYRSQFPNQ